MENFRLKVERDGADPFYFSHIGLILSIGKIHGQLTLRDDNVNDLQCSLVIQPQSYLLVDHNSSTGTYLNNRMIGQQPVEVGDEIRLGKYTLQILELNGRENFSKVFQDRQLEEIYQWIIKSYSSHLATF